MKKHFFTEHFKTQILKSPLTFKICLFYNKRLVEICIFVEYKKVGFRKYLQICLKVFLKLLFHCTISVTFFVLFQPTCLQRPVLLAFGMLSPNNEEKILKTLHENAIIVV